MADNDEYQFTELDPINPSAMDTEQGAADASGVPTSAGPLGGSNVKRNAIIAVVVFIFLMVLYKFVGAYLTNKKTEIASIPASVPAPTSIVEPKPIVALPSSSAPETTNHDLQSKISTIEINQENLHSEISTVNGQISDINSNLETLTGKITELNSAITTLSEKLEAQSREIERLSVKAVVASPVRHAVRPPVRPYLKYYVQAIIPGRAWLVATNGRTLTVREGSALAGYGTVKLIDPNQGRVITSSGQVIRFSQDDS